MEWLACISFLLLWKGPVWSADIELLAELWMGITIPAFVSRKRRSQESICLAWRWVTNSFMLEQLNLMPTISLFVLTVSNLKQEWEDPAGDYEVWQCLSELDSQRGNISLGEELFIWSVHNFPLRVGFPLFLWEWIWVFLFGLATKMSTGQGCLQLCLLHHREAKIVYGIRKKRKWSHFICIRLRTVDNGNQKHLGLSRTV